MFAVCWLLCDCLRLRFASASPACHSQTHSQNDEARGWAAADSERQWGERTAIHGAGRDIKGAAENFGRRIRLVCEDYFGAIQGSAKRFNVGGNAMC